MNSRLNKYSDDIYSKNIKRPSSVRKTYLQITERWHAWNQNWNRNQKLNHIGFTVSLCRKSSCLKLNDEEENWQNYEGSSGGLWNDLKTPESHETYLRIFPQIWTRTLVSPSSVALPDTPDSCSVLVLVLVLVSSGSGSALMLDSE